VISAHRARCLMPELTQPQHLEFYHPQEQPNRYPLELCDCADTHLHICLWSEDGSFKWTVAYFVKEKDGYILRFCGDRPLNPRVDWGHFRELVVQGQQIVDKRFLSED